MNCTGRVLRAQSRAALQGSSESGAGTAREGGDKMNLTAEMIPGICVLVAGALMSFFADWLCRRKANVGQVRVLGVMMAFIGAILVFIP